MISRYDPFREALSLRRAMDQLFEQSFVNPGLTSNSSWLMAPMDVRETQSTYEVDVALPGVRPEDIELTVDQNMLTVRGHSSHQNEHDNQPQGQTQSKPQAGQPQWQQSQQDQPEPHRQGSRWLTKEIVSGSFERTVSLPRSIDTNTIQTSFENGLLTIHLSINETSRPKRIALTGDQQRVAVGAGQFQR